MSGWTDEDVDLPSSISELATALQVSNVAIATLAAGSSSTPTITSSSQQDQEDSDPDLAPVPALTLEDLLGTRRPRTPEHAPTQSGEGSRPRSRALGMSWPNDGIEPPPRRTRRRWEDEELPWQNAVETARRAGYTALNTGGAGTSGDASGSASRQEISAAARALREHIRLERGIAAGPSRSPLSAAYALAGYANAARLPAESGERNQRMATTLLRRRRTEEERRRDRDRDREADDQRGGGPRAGREIIRPLDGSGISRTHITYGFDPTDIEPPGGADDHMWDRLGTLDASSDDDEDEGVEGWGAFRDGAPIGDFQPGVLSLAADAILDFDVDGWGSAPNLAGGSALSRGGFNRRRQSMRGRLREGGDIDPDPELEEYAIDFSPTRRIHRAAAQQHLIRRREAEPASDSDASMGSSTPLKRRKRDAPTSTVDTSRPSYVGLTTLPPTTELPTTFLTPRISEDARHTSFLDLSVQERKGAYRPVVTFRPRNMGQLTYDDIDACSLYTSRPIPRGVGVHYFEVEVLNSGKRGHISVGWSKGKGDQRRLVGWDKGSWGWHADDGKTFEGSGEGRHFSDPWKTGTIVGCGIDLTIGRAFFTRNGALLGHAFTKMPSGLYPSVGMRNMDESIAVNLTGPFEYDIDTHVLGVRSGIRDALKPKHEAFSSVPPIIPVPKLVGVPQPSRSSTSSLSQAQASKNSDGKNADTKGEDGLVRKGDDQDLSEPGAVLLARLRSRLDDAKRNEAARISSKTDKGKGKSKSSDSGKGKETDTMQEEEDAFESALGSTALASGPSRAAAALVLEHLATSGLDGVRAALVRDMQKRGRLPPLSSEAVSSTASPNHLSSQRASPTTVSQVKEPGPDATNSDYPSTPAAILAAVTALQSGEVRWPLIHSLSSAPSSISSDQSLVDLVEPLSRRLEIYAFASLARLSSSHNCQDADGDSVMSDHHYPDDDVQLRAVAVGRELDTRSREEEWGDSEVELLSRANRQMVLADDSLDEDRKKDAGTLDQVLRDANGVLRNSCLHMAVAQTGLVHEVLCERGDESAAMMGVKAVFE